MQRWRSRLALVLLLAGMDACVTTADPMGPPPASPPTVSPAGSPGAGPCPPSGSYRHRTDGVGDARIDLAPQPDGTFRATESGLANFNGVATFTPPTLSIRFTTNNGFAGVYTWTLDASCSRGEGQLVFTAGGSGTHRSTLERER